MYSKRFYLKDRKYTVHINDNKKCDLTDVHLYTRPHL